jgi:hypothetical protein
MLLRPQAMVLAAVVTLAGCATLGYQPTDSYLHTRAAAELGNTNAQLDLARMYADPAQWPQMQGRQPDPVRAAKWCYIFQSQNVTADPAVAARGRSCQQIMASLPPDAVNQGIGRGADYFNRDWYMIY